MDGATFLSLDDGFAIERVSATPTMLLVEIVSRAANACCPLCQHVAQRRQSCYRRRIADLPCAGRQAHLTVTVRKFLCQNPDCPRQIFAERLPGFVHPYARRTSRLCTILCTLGLVAGGETGTRLAAKLGIQTSPSTLVRLPLPALPTVRIVVVDDWSWTKGRRYGTILVDLERRHIVDVLSDRCRSTFAEWLRAHPEIEIIRRDRATEYAAAAREAAPHAIQIADRFHLVRNLADALERLLARCRTDVRRAACPAAGIPGRDCSQPDALPLPPPWRPQHQANVELLFQARHAQRTDRFEQALALRTYGLSLRQIAQHVGRCERTIRTIRTWLRRGTAPTYRQTRKRRSAFDPYAAYVLDRWQAGVRDGK